MQDTEVRLSRLLVPRLGTLVEHVLRDGELRALRREDVHLEQESRGLRRPMSTLRLRALVDALTMCHWMWQWNAQKPGLSATKRRIV